MNGSGILDDDGDVPYMPTSIPGVDEQKKMVKDSEERNKKMRETERKKRERAEMKKKIKGSFRRGWNWVKRGLSRKDRSSRQNTGHQFATPSRAARDLYKSGQIGRVGGSKRKRKRNRTARKPKKRSKRTRRQNVNRQKR
tara:strand:- start:52 stop:471 length:420 start_codon:yes stop_codon:yes gene_type:complete